MYAIPPKRGTPPPVNHWQACLLDHMDEQKLVKLYMQLTGSPESEARNVFMFVCPPRGEAPARQTHLAPDPSSNDQITPVRPTLTLDRTGSSLLILGCLWLGTPL